jgi:hypothetical protein
LPTAGGSPSALPLPVGFSCSSPAISLPGSMTSSTSSGVPQSLAPLTPSAANRLPAALRRVAVWVPEPSERTLGEVLSSLLAAAPAEPFAAESLAAADRFARRLMSDPLARAHPELMSLGFFMRKAELMRAQAERARAARPDIVEVPVGLVFHVPPANVDTIFMYSWLQSLLAGNLNLVRLSARSSPLVEHLCHLLCEVLAAPELAGVRSRTAMIQYGHDDVITAAISSHAALRVIWGGDATVAAIRKSPLPPHGRDLPFADRFSLLALAAAAVTDSNKSELAHLVEQLYNDLYWFDQAGCSSPRLCLWVGSAAEVAAARTLLWPALAAHAARRGYHPDLAMRMAKELFCHRAVLDGPVTACHVYGPALTVLAVSTLEGLGREHPGAGLLFETVVDPRAGAEPSSDASDASETCDASDAVVEGGEEAPADGIPIETPQEASVVAQPVAHALERVLGPWLTRKEQTLATFGIPRADLVELARRLTGRGLDRIVPVGQALQMSRFWDGYDLAAEMIRRVHLVG